MGFHEKWKESHILTKQNKLNYETLPQKICSCDLNV